MVGQIYFIIVRFSYLGFMGEPTGTLVLFEHDSSGYRHKGELPVIVHPGTGLVGLFEPFYFVGIVCICPTVAHISGLRSPEVHTPRHCNSWIGISGG